MDKKQYQLPAEVLSGFKTAGELESFLQGLFKQGVEQLLEAEMEEHLGYSKHSRAGSVNSRNGKGSKQLKTALGDIHIQPPRDRKGSFQPLVIGKRKGVMEKIEDIVISLYARGMSTRDIERVCKINCVNPWQAPWGLPRVDFYIKSNIILPGNQIASF